MFSPDEPGAQCFENGLDTLILVFITTNAVFSDYIAI
jgi:hypothetical protein